MPLSIDLFGARGFGGRTGNGSKPAYGAITTVVFVELVPPPAIDARASAAASIFFGYRVARTYLVGRVDCHGRKRRRHGRKRRGGGRRRRHDSIVIMNLIDRF